jgi:hemerythrin-like domain-containing protein
MEPSRRLLLSRSGLVGATLLWEACKPASSPSSSDANGGRPGDQRAGAAPGKPGDDAKDSSEEVTATEDLMREHGVLRRALVVYREAAVRLRANAVASVPPNALAKTAKLFRAFGEDYHERKLEEAYIFPAVKKAGGPAAVYPDILTAQHRRGREITEYILAVTQGAKIGAHAPTLARVLDEFARMYEPHTAIEDTVVFPAWKRTMSPKELDAMGDKFEDIEHDTFGKDGFGDAVEQIGRVEAELGLTDLSKCTAPSPPKA